MALEMYWLRFLNFQTFPDKNQESAGLTPQKFNVHSESTDIRILLFKCFLNIAAKIIIRALQDQAKVPSKSILLYLTADHQMPREAHKTPGHPVSVHLIWHCEGPHFENQKAAHTHHGL